MKTGENLKYKINGKNGRGTEYKNWLFAASFPFSAWCPPSWLCSVKLLKVCSLSDLQRGVLALSLCVWLDDNEGSSSDTAPLFQMAGDGKNTDDITIPMLFLFNKEGNIILDAIREYEAVEVLLSDKAKDRGKIKGFL